MKQFFSKLSKVFNLTISLVIVNFLFAITAQAQRGTQPTSTNTTTTGGGAGEVTNGLNKIKSIFPTLFGKADWTLIVLIEVILNLAIYFAFIGAVIFVVIGGYRYLSAGGNDTQATDGRKTLQNALIGMAIVFLSYVLVQVVFRFLVDSTT